MSITTSPAPLTSSVAASLALQRHCISRQRAVAEGVKRLLDSAMPVAELDAEEGA